MEKLTIEEAIKRLQHIEEVKSDYEQAHVEEYDLKTSYLTSVSDGKYSLSEAIEVAKIVLQVEKIEFSRYFA